MAGLPLFSQNCHFILTAGKPSQLPSEAPPEIAFFGRSNTGKSSLLNALLKQKNLARSGNRPGLTRAMIVFAFDNGIRLIDFPGYGYSQGGSRYAANNHNMIVSYLEKRRTIHLVCLLIDARRAIMAQDHKMLEAITKAGHQGIVIITKIDKLPIAMQQQQYQKISHILASLCPHWPAPLSTSAHKGIGIDALRQFLEQSLQSGTAMAKGQ